MKVLMIYYTGSLDDVSTEYCNDEDKEKSRLYAITNSKKLFKSFMSIRNKKIFKVKKLECSASEYSELCKEFRGSIIDNYNLTTNMSKEPILMTITNYEYQVATDEYPISCIMEDSSYWKSVLPSKVFKSDIRKALYTLQYQKVMKFAADTILDEDDDYEAPDMEVDMLQQFISNFGPTLSVKD